MVVDGLQKILFDITYNWIFKVIRQAVILSREQKVLEYCLLAPWLLSLPEENIGWRTKSVSFSQQGIDTC